MLTPTQTLAAAELLSIRPPVLTGTRVIIKDADREWYYKRVTEVMTAKGVKDETAVNEFCDIAGVPD